MSEILENHIEEEFYKMFAYAYREVDEVKLTPNNIALKYIEKYAQMPVFLLNDLNYPAIRNELSRKDNSKELLNKLDTLAQPELAKKQDDLSFWLIEVEHDKIIDILKALSSGKAYLDLIDPKIHTYLKRIKKFNKEGVFNQSDLIAAFIAFRDAL